MKTRPGIPVLCCAWCRRPPYLFADLGGVTIACHRADCIKPPDAATAQRWEHVPTRLEAKTRWDDATEADLHRIARGPRLVGVDYGDPASERCGCLCPHCRAPMVWQARSAPPSACPSCLRTLSWKAIA